jgi:glycosyltransferase involved in cell wall biosynthesis
MIAKNEAGRWLAQSLGSLLSCCDKVLVLDDQSTDETADMARSLHCDVRVRSGAPMWGQEAPARAELWDWAAKEAGDGWVLIGDADMVLVGDPAPYLYSREVNAWSFILYDQWNETEYRADGFWRGHEFPRPWLFSPSRVPANWAPVWVRNGLHVGHAPPNYPLVASVAPTLSWRHLQYSTPESRQQKYAAYASQHDQLTPFEQAHYQSILDPVA